MSRQQLPAKGEQLLAPIVAHFRRAVCAAGLAAAIAAGATQTALAGEAAAPADAQGAVAPDHEERPP